MGFFGNLFGGGASDFNNTLNGSNQLFKTASGQGNTLFGQGQNINGMLTPFFQQEMTNPQGLGATTMNQMKTSAGQSIAGGVGGAEQSAKDMAARTGNTAAIPSIINAAAKQGIGAQTASNLGIDTQNAMLKLQQQQQGASGLGGLLSGDLSGAQGFENTANSALNTELGAEKAQQQAQQQGMSNIMKLAGGVMGGLPMGAGSIGDIGSNILGGMS